MFSIQQQLLDHIFHLLGDKDARVRSAVAAALCSYLSSQAATKTNGFDATSSNADNRSPTITTKALLFKEFVSERVFNDLPHPLSHVLDTGPAFDTTIPAAFNTSTITNEAINYSGVLDAVLAKVLFHLTNVALELNGDKHQQVSVLDLSGALREQYGQNGGGG